MTAAAARAAHLVVDESPFIFADTCAAALLGERAEELVGYHRNHGSHPILTAARGQVVCRSRYAEDRIAVAVASGVHQYVVLGAGLDTFGYRSPLAASVRVFEVDHPATQAWKQSALSAAGLNVPPGVVFVPADLATVSGGGDGLSNRKLRPSLRAAGFDFGEPAVISLLGVLMYLDREAIIRTLRVLAQCAPGTELIADYMLTAELRDEAGDQYVELVGPASAERGEPWLSFFTPAAMNELLTAHGFGPATHARQREAVPADLWQRTDALRPIELSMIACSRLGAGQVVQSLRAV
jgi:methyltransferase (TIGR00027 family)